MYDKFKSTFLLDKPTNRAHSEMLAEKYESHLQELFAMFGGASFSGGLYRIMDSDASTHWSSVVRGAFQDFSDEGRVICFGFDWLGRVFGVDSKRMEDGLPAVVMFEPGTGQALEVPCNVYTFHENELIAYKEEALAASFFSSWMSSGGEKPAVTECIGYKKPLFLGGKDVVENLERSDMEVYWAIAAQLINKARGLPVGTRLGNVRID